jgi:hypothetical protein
MVSPVELVDASMSLPFFFFPFDLFPECEPDCNVCDATFSHVSCNLLPDKLGVLLS